MTHPITFRLSDFVTQKLNADCKDSVRTCFDLAALLGGVEHIDVVGTPMKLTGDMVIPKKDGAYLDASLRFLCDRLIPISSEAQVHFWDLTHGADFLEPNASVHKQGIVIFALVPNRDLCALFSITEHALDRMPEGVWDEHTFARSAHEKGGDGAWVDAICKRQPVQIISFGRDGNEITANDISARLTRYCPDVWRGPFQDMKSSRAMSELFQATTCRDYARYLGGRAEHPYCQALQRHYRL